MLVRMDRTAREHWESTYGDLGTDRVSWFQREPVLSLELLRLAGLGPSSRVIDVGGGASVLVDRLLDADVTDVTVLDVADTALSVSKARLGPRTDLVKWLVADLLTWVPQRTFDLWHDRAVFHFLTDPRDRARYASTLDVALAPGGHMVIGAFSENGPDYCSGLPVRRYSSDQLAGEFPTLQPVHAERERHHTPTGGLQEFTWLVLRRPR
jgi:Methyltransferase domain